MARVRRTTFPAVLTALLTSLLIVYCFTASLLLDCLTALLLYCVADAGGSVFCVATYHMPCVFWDQRVMLIHTVLVAQKV